MADDDENTEGNTDENNDEGTDSTQSKESTLTQADLNRIADSEKKEGRAAALREMAEKLGIDDLDEAARILKEARDREDQDESEAQKAREAADKEKAEAEKAKAEATQEKHTLRVERHLLRAGVPEGEGEDEGKALAKASRMLDVETGADADEIKEAVEELKKDLPALLTTSKESESGDTGNGGRNKDSDTGGLPQREATATAKTKARERLEKAHPHLRKSD